MSESPFLLPYESHALDGFVGWALELIGERYGIQVVKSMDGTPTLYHGNDPGWACTVRVPHVSDYTEHTIPTEIKAAMIQGVGAVFPFDVFAAVRFWVTDAGNVAAPNSAYDRHDRLLGGASVQSRLGVLRTPIVNACLDLFVDWMRQAIPGFRCSKEPQAQVILSHDADNPIDPQDPTHALWGARRAAVDRNYSLSARKLGSATRRALRRAVGQKRRHWNFADLMALEDGFGFRSTFFFSARMRGEPHTSKFDESYDIRDGRFGQLFAELRSEGWEIGLHASYLGRDSPVRIQQERERLESVAGVRVLGNRHHYWHMKRPFWSTLEDHGAAGLRYDASIAFNEVPGFRLGVAMPLRLWNPRTRATLPTVHLPTMVMDGAYFYRPEMTVEGALGDFDGLLTELVKHRGTAALNWHARWSVPVDGEDPS